MKILFVCAGNICRSPMAEVIFRNIAKKHNRTDITVQSAGTCACVGCDMTPFARDALVELGLLEFGENYNHTATQFTMDMKETFDHIVDLRDFADPYGGDLPTYIDVCKQLQEYCETLYTKWCKT